LIHRSRRAPVADGARDDDLPHRAGAGRCLKLDRAALRTTWRGCGERRACSDHAREQHNYNCRPSQDEPSLIGTHYAGRRPGYRLPRRANWGTAQSTPQMTGDAYSSPASIGEASSRPGPLNLGGVVRVTWPTMLRKKEDA